MPGADKLCAPLLGHMQGPGWVAHVTSYWVVHQYMESICDLGLPRRSLSFPVFMSDRYVHSEVLLVIVIDLDGLLVTEICAGIY